MWSGLDDIRALPALLMDMLGLNLLAASSQAGLIHRWRVVAAFTTPHEPWAVYRGSDPIQAQPWLNVWWGQLRGLCETSLLLVRIPVVV